MGPLFIRAVAIKGRPWAGMKELAAAHGRGADDEELMALSGLNQESLKAITSSDLFKGLSREEAKRLANGAI